MLYSLISHATLGRNSIFVCFAGQNKLCSTLSKNYQNLKKRGDAQARNFYNVAGKLLPGGNTSPVHFLNCCTGIWDSGGGYILYLLFLQPWYFSAQFFNYLTLLDRHDGRVMSNPSGGHQAGRLTQGIRRQPWTIIPFLHWPYFKKKRLAVRAMLSLPVFIIPLTRTKQSRTNYFTDCLPYFYNPS